MGNKSLKVPLFKGDLGVSLSVWYMQKNFQTPSKPYLTENKLLKIVVCGFSPKIML